MTTTILLILAIMFTLPTWVAWEFIDGFVSAIIRAVR